MKKIKNSSDTSLSTDIRLLLNITLSLSVLLYLFLCVASIIVIELGAITKFLDDIRTLTLNSTRPISSELNINQTDKPVMKMS